MPYVLRFVQRFRISEEKAFLELEKQFAELERANPSMPQGVRMRPVSGREPGHTLIWECQFASMQELTGALDALGHSEEHGQIFAQQSPLMLEVHTEIYELLDL
jgi:hypothetical protein